MKKVIATAGVAASLFVPSAAYAAAPAAQPSDPSRVSVEVASAIGSGCPDGGASARLSSDLSSIVVTTPAYFAVSGRDAEATDFRQNCQISLQVTKPERWTYAVSSVESTGFAYLRSSSSTAVSRVALYFQGDSNTVDLTNTIQGPTIETWETSDEVAEEDLVFEPCDAERNLNINTEVRVSPNATGRQTNLMVRDSETRFGLVWQRCD